MIDVVIPTLKPREDIQHLVDEINFTAGMRVRVHPTCTPGSAAENRNLGLGLCESEMLVMVDDDVAELPRGWVRKLVTVLNIYPDCVLVSARLRNPDGSPQAMLGRPAENWDGCEVVAYRALPTTCCAVRRNSLRFDEEYRGSGWEDTDYCWQLRHLIPNAQFVCDHDLRVTHLDEKKNQMGENWDLNRKRFKSKWATP